MTSDYYVLEFENKNTKISDLKLFFFKNGKLKPIKTINNKDKKLTLNDNKIISNSNGVDDSKKYRDMIETSFRIKSDKIDHQKLIKTDNNFRFYINKHYILEIDSNLNIECYFYTASDVVNNKEELVYIKDTIIYDGTTKLANIKFLRSNKISQKLRKSSFKSKVIDNKVEFKDLDFEEINIIK